ncbi:MAG: PEP-CTERM sorting domain-containing protein [Phycisphaerae bacterium]
MRKLCLRTRSSLAFASVFAAGLSLSASAETVRQAAGPDAAAIQSELDSFRADLGALNPNVPGSFGAGRREINWDAVPDSASSPNAFPGTFFNGTTTGRARGIEFLTPGAGFEVSADNDNPTGTPADFAHIDPSYADNFAAFSPQRLFAAIGSNVTEVRFFIPGTTTPTTTRGFGAVFSDVDLDGTTSIELYDATGELLYEGAAPAAGIGDQTFSFLGVSFDEAIVARVLVFSGTAALGAGVLDEPGAGADLVVMDDFVYGEPVPEPASLALLSVAGIFAGRRICRLRSEKT